MIVSGETRTDTNGASPRRHSSRRTGSSPSRSPRPGQRPLGVGDVEHDVVDAPDPHRPTVGAGRDRRTSRGRRSPGRSSSAGSGSRGPPPMTRFATLLPSHLCRPVAAAAWSPPPSSPITAASPHPVGVRRRHRLRAGWCPGRTRRTAVVSRGRPRSVHARALAGAATPGRRPDRRGHDDRGVGARRATTSRSCSTEGLPVLLGVVGEREADRVHDCRRSTWRSGTWTPSLPSPRSRSPPIGTCRWVHAAGDLVAGGAGRRQPRSRWTGGARGAVPAPADGELGRRGRRRRRRRGRSRRSGAPAWSGGAAACRGGPVDMGLADGTDGRRRGLVAGRAPPRGAPPTACGRGGGRRLGRRRRGVPAASVTIPNFVTPGSGRLRRARTRWSSPCPTGSPPSASTARRSTPSRSRRPRSPALTAAAVSVVVNGWDGRLAGGRTGSTVVELAPATNNLVDVSVPAGVDELVTVDHYGTVRRLDVAPTARWRPIDRYAAGEANSIDVAPDGGRRRRGDVDGSRAACCDVQRHRRAGARTAPGQRGRRRLRPGRAAAGDRPRRPGAGPRCGTTRWTSPIWTAADRDVVRRRGGERHRVLVLPGRGRLLARRVVAGGDVARLHRARHVDRRPVTTPAGDRARAATWAPSSTSSSRRTARCWRRRRRTARCASGTSTGGRCATSSRRHGRRLLGAGVHARRLGAGRGRRHRHGLAARHRDRRGAADVQRRQGADRATWCSRPTATRLVAGGVDGTVEVWSVERGEVVQRLRATRCPSPTSP